MICRRCGAELPDNAIRCGTCGLKVNMLCPKCKTLSPFGTKLCNNCGFELLKSCPTCGGLNVYSATICRKCNSELEEVVVEQQVEIKEDSPYIEIVGSFSSQNTSYVQRENFNIEHSLSRKEKVVSETGIPLYEEQKEEKIFIVDEPDKSEEIKEESHAPIEPVSEPVVKENEEIQEDTLIEETFEIEDIQEVKDENEEENKEESTENEEETVEDNEEAIIAEIQPAAVNKAIHLIKNSLTKQVIAINGDEGTGKSAVLKQVSDNLVKKGTQKFIKKFCEINKNDAKLNKYIEGINILRPTLIFAGIYYCILPIFTTYISDKIDNLTNSNNKAN